MPEEQSPEFDAKEVRKFARLFAIVAAFLCALPVLIGYATSDGGYLPFHLSLDDHMVYAAWMHQAMEGRLLFDNRFTTDPQPGLTFQLFFLTLGWIAKLVGIPITLTLARIGLSYLAVRLLGEFIVRLGLQSFTGKFALVMSVFGGGLAFLNWHNFGDVYSHGPSWLVSLLNVRQPIDNWQPEAFVFPSMLTNGLFLAALCLILWTLNAILDARASWKAVIPGAIAFGILANVHTYDVALIALVLLAFVATLTASGLIKGVWLARSLVIGLGAIPAGAWLLYVLGQDPVFQARAQTLTYTGGFSQIAMGVLPLFILSLLALWRSDLPAKRRAIACGAVVVFVAALWAVATPREGYVLNAPAWVAFFVAAIAVAVLTARKDVGWNLLWSWAMVSLVAPYFPALFQRKLSMMLVVPWAIIAAIGLAGELRRMERQPRNLVAVLLLAIVCLTSVFWLRRDMELLKLGVSKTAVHNLHLTRDEQAIVKKLDEVGQGQGTIAIPGVPAPGFDQQAFITDLQPVLSGLSGVHTYAGHWSETPDYAKKRNDLTAFYSQQMPIDQRKALLAKWKVEFVVAPMPTAYEGLFPDLRNLGEVLYQGEQLALIRVNRQ